MGTRLKVFLQLNISWPFLEHIFKIVKVIIVNINTELPRKHWAFLKYFLPLLGRSFKGVFKIEGRFLVLETSGWQELCGEKSFCKEKIAS